jgi:alanyl-tRNA synthetase
MFRLVPVLASVMGEQYPELLSGKEQIAKIIFEEETSFLKTLGKGLKMIERMINDLKREQKNILPGKVAFEMYDTFGFPVDLTQLILKEHDMHLDLNGFEAEMKNQKNRSREDASVEADDWTIVKEIEGTEFTGYKKTEDDVIITKYRGVKVKGKESFQLVFNKTPFYAEAGGQAGDTGFISSSQEKIGITDTYKENNLILHIAGKLPSDITSAFKATVDGEKRLMTANNHTATHLIHFALRSVLGKHVEQKGSLVTPDRLRFDFSHFSKMTKEELSKVEEMVNRMVRNNYTGRITDSLSMEEAKSMGAMALFGEKYGNQVRVVEFGDSIELCGGTHVESTGSIGIVKIISEGAIAAGIRRIEAVTASKAEEYINEKLKIVDNISALLKSSGGITDSVEKLLSENNSLKKTVEKFRIQSAIDNINELINKAVVVNNIRFVSGKVETDSSEVLKNIAFQIRTSSSNTVMVIGSELNGKASLLVTVTDDLVRERNINAVAIIRDISSEINGGGGGQPFLATAGGKNPNGIQPAIKKAAEFIQKS